MSDSAIQTAPQRCDGYISNGDLLFRLEAIALSNGVPLYVIAQDIEMPDGRSARDWLVHRGLWKGLHKRWMAGRPARKNQ